MLEPLALLSLHADCMLIASLIASLIRLPEPLALLYLPWLLARAVAVEPERARDGARHLYWDCSAGGDVTLSADAAAAAGYALGTALR